METENIPDVRRTEPGEDARELVDKIYIAWAESLPGLSCEKQGQIAAALIERYVAAQVTGYESEADRLSCENIAFRARIKELEAEVNELKDNPRDDYHTMHELYQHREALTALVVSLIPERCVKSKLHNDGSMFEGDYFVVFINLGEQYVSYHYALSHWNDFKCQEVERAPKWDGHTPNDCVDRILQAAQTNHPLRAEIERLKADRAELQTYIEEIIKLEASLGTAFSWADLREFKEATRKIARAALATPAPEERYCDGDRCGEDCDPNCLVKKDPR